MRANPPLRVRTAQRPGTSEPSEDRIFVTDTAIIILDGASQTIPLDRSGGWMAQQLGSQLAKELGDETNDDLRLILKRSIKAVVDEFNLVPGQAPSTTVSIVRRRANLIDLLVLCDSPIVYQATTGAVAQVRDDRLAHTAARIPHPTGPKDPNDPSWLQWINDFETYRNHPDGFWVASATPQAADFSIVETIPSAEISTILAMTDGVSTGVDIYRRPESWPHAIRVARDRPDNLVEIIHRAELDDPDCIAWPRSKQHDDKSLAVLNQI